MDKLYTRIDFVNDGVPALNDTNLNAMSKGIDDIDNRLVEIAAELVGAIPEIEVGTKAAGVTPITITTHTGTQVARINDGEQGERGPQGSKWYRGTAVSGKSTVPTSYNTGIEYANVDDNYLNRAEGAIYYCVTAGIPSVAKWVYDFTLTGGGGGGGVTDYDELTGKPSLEGKTISGTHTADYYGLVKADSLADVATSGSYNDLTGAPELANVATTGSYNDLSNKPTIPTVPTNVSAFTNDAGYITGVGVWATASAESAVGATSVTIATTDVTANSNIDVYTQNASGNAQSYTGMTVTAGTSVTINFKPLKEATTFRVWIH